MRALVIKSLSLHTAIDPVIPLCDVIPIRSLPILTLGLIATNCLFFVVLELADVSTQALPAADLVSEASAWSSLVFVGALFVHSNGFQLVISMLYLWIFGSSVEARLGRVRFALLYLICGVAAGGIHSWLHPWWAEAVTGSTGAVTGVLSAYLVLYPRSQVLAWIPLPVWLVEIPAAYFLGLWGVLHTLDALGALAQLHADGLSGRLSVGAFAASSVAGVILCLILRRPVEWRVE